ncbi:MAG TPA: glycosyltransferase [Actinomycetota bacterium]|nr:glycosyltransferase [Actinomycetota bacterium]
MNPLVSIVSPVHNGERWLDESIASVGAQTYQPIELIVVDDGSTDGSAEVARRLGVKLVQQSQAGQPAAMNTGVRATLGDFIGFIDADDRYPPGRVESMMSILLTRPEVEGVFGLMEEFAEEVVGPIRSVRAPATNRHPACMVMRKSLLERVGPFDETLELASVPAWVALAQSQEARLVAIDEVVLFRRLHDSNMGLSGWKHRAEYARAMHSGLVARRKPPGKSDQ